MSQIEKNYLSPFTLQFVLGRRTVTVSIPPFVIVLMMLSAVLGYGVSSLSHLSQEREMLSLREQNQELTLFLQREKAGSKRLAELAETRSQELWKELDRRQAEVSQVWGMLTQLQRPSRAHRAPLASRGGRRHLSIRGPHFDFAELQARVRDHGSELDRLSAAAWTYRQTRLEEEKAQLALHTPTGPPCEGEMTSPFGPRVHPIYGYGRPHNGCDFTTPEGTDILATGEGTVVSSDWLGGYGKAVEIDHGQGIHTLYAHCEELKVKKGQKVHRGERIATVGMTGLASGPHCHYEVHHDGKPVDPKAYLDVPATNLSNMRSPITAN